MPRPVCARPPCALLFVTLLALASGCDRVPALRDKVEGLKTEAEAALEAAKNKVDRATGGEPVEAAADPLDADPVNTEFVEPPFKVSGNLKGLHLVWFDGEGVHTAKSRDGIPEESRGRVRVESLTRSPEDVTEDSSVFVADVRVPLPGGSYPVQRVRRAVFERWVVEATGEGARRRAREEEELRAFKQAEQAKERDAKAERAAPGGGVRADVKVVMYRTSWCGYCKKAARYFTSKNVPFTEKDIEKDPAAGREMKEKLARANLSGNGVPVIDVDGTIIQGFNQPAIERALSN